MNILLSLENNENKHSPKFRCISKRFTDNSTNSTSEIFWLKFNAFLKEFKEKAETYFTTESIKLETF